MRFIFFLLFLSPCLLMAQEDSSKQQPNTISIFPTNNPNSIVRLQVLQPGIIQVLKSESRDIKQGSPSLVVLPQSLFTNYTVDDSDKDSIRITTSLLIVKASLSTGHLVFYDKKGNSLFNSIDRINPDCCNTDVPMYRPTQFFVSDSTDAWYGLGQHQDGYINYRNHQAFLFQNNTEVAIPFLISKKNYGILWDNNSITEAGQVRPYLDLDELSLFDRNHRPNGLTVSYVQGVDTILQQQDSIIHAPYLGDTKAQWPSAFKGSKGKIIWEGYLQSPVNGVYRFRWLYGGYLKVWINDELVVDRWRQSWNPGTALSDIPLQSSASSKIKIEWIPAGDESYISVQWQQPIVNDDENVFGFDSHNGNVVDYYVIHGNSMDEIIAGYRQLTGKATLLPKWAYGFWQSRERYKTQNEVLNTIAEFRKRKLPIDNIVLDWSYWKEDAWGSQEFDASRFPGPDSMISLLHKTYNARFMISVWPKFYEGIEAYNYFNDRGWLYKRNIADRQRDWIGKGYVSTFYDAFNKEAQKGFWELLNRKLFSKGVDAWWMDASEPDILSNVSPFKRIQQMEGLAIGSADDYLNAYPLMNAQGIYEGQRSVKPDQRVFILTRSGFSGMQRYAAATWSGDIASRWHDMKDQIAAGIGFSMSGLPNWTMDIGGFAVEKRFEKPDSINLEEWRELQTRWFQFGAFVPLFRSHGQYPYREIFHIAPNSHPAYQSMEWYLKLRYTLLPYIYSLAGQTYHHNYTIMRGLVMDFPNDTAVTNIADQYMFGPSILVSPVYTFKQRSKPVYLPKGNGWFDMYSGKFYKGGQIINADAPYERMPIFIKGGSIIPAGPALQYTDEKKPDTITLHVYGGADAKFELYEDDGLNYQYEQGKFSTIQFTYNEYSKLLTIHQRNGAYPGMLTKRVFIVKYYSPHNAMGFGIIKKKKEITYVGNAVKVDLHAAR